MCSIERVGRGMCSSSLGISDSSCGILERTMPYVPTFRHHFDLNAAGSKWVNSNKASKYSYVFIDSPIGRLKFVLTVSAHCGGDEAV